MDINEFLGISDAIRKLVESGRLTGKDQVYVQYENEIVSLVELDGKVDILLHPPKEDKFALYDEDDLALTNKQRVSSGREPYERSELETVVVLGSTPNS